MLTHSLARLAAIAALPLAIAGCDMDKLEFDPGTQAAADAFAVPPLGQELYRMFRPEKASALAGELPPQF